MVLSLTGISYPLLIKYTFIKCKQGRHSPTLRKLIAKPSPKQIHTVASCRKFMKKRKWNNKEVEREDPFIRMVLAKDTEEERLM